MLGIYKIVILPKILFKKELKVFQLFSTSSVESLSRYNWASGPRLKMRSSIDRPFMKPRDSWRTCQYCGSIKLRSKKDGEYIRRSVSDPAALSGMSRMERTIRSAFAQRSITEIGSGENTGRIRSM